MARTKNDGKGRLGGRQKGTPNKVTASVKEWISKVINKNRRQMERDLKELEPKERLMMLEKLMAYVIPKQQAVTADVDISALTEEQLDNVVNSLLTQMQEDDS